MHFISSDNINARKFKIKNLGGKAYHLLKMYKSGFPVPPFFIIPVNVVNYILKPVKIEIGRISGEMYKDGNNDAKKLVLLSSEIQKKITQLKFPDDLKRELYAECRKNFGKSFTVAIRSSGVAEDSSQASFAGQFSTFLHIDRESLIPKILECIASAWGAGVLSYSAKQGILRRNRGMAVIIQQMVAAEKSGVSFSMNVRGNLNDMLIVAGYGLGEGIVTDKAETDTYFIDRQNKILRKQLSEKKTALFRVSGNNLKMMTVEKSRKNVAALNDREIMQVFDHTLQAEKLLGRPSDIEFSFDKTGKLHVLQMRPVTGLNIDDIKILDNTNIVESYPGITLPLSYSFALEAYEKVFSGSSKAFWVSKSSIKENNAIFKHLLEHFRGRVYYRLDNWYRMMAMVHNSRRSVAAWENAVGLPNSESDKYIPSFKGRIRILVSSVWLLLKYRSGNRRFFRLFNENYRELSSYKRHLSSPAKLWEHYEQMTNRMFRSWYLTLINDFLAFKAFGWLQQLIKRFRISDNENFANDLVCGTENMESEKAVLKMLELKEYILADDDLSELFSGDMNDILKSLSQKKYKPLYDLIQEYIDKYGDRTLAELKLETRSFRQQPEQFIRLIRNQLSSPVTLDSYERNRRAIKNNAKAIVILRLKWWDPRTCIFGFVRWLAAFGLESRENMRFCRTRAYGTVKEIFLELGKMMFEQHLLQDPEDLFYLDINDLREFCTQDSFGNQSEKIHARKKQYSEYDKIGVPDRIMYVGDIPGLPEIQTQTRKDQDRYYGISVSKGSVTAEAVVLTSPDVSTAVKGKILVTRMTDPGWVFLMVQAAGLISEKGSLLSHTAIVGRELGIPVVVGVQDATSVFKTGDILMLDGDKGIITVDQTENKNETNVDFKVES